MKSSEIKNINHALFVLKHFVELSARLLPVLYDFERKANLKSDEERNRNKIINVYQNYAFDVGASRHLINSDVLLLIKESFEAIVYEENTRKRRKLRDFLSEYHCLRNQWEIAESN
jgi:hypothetical protein